MQPAAIAAVCRAVRGVQSLDRQFQTDVFKFKTFCQQDQHR